MATVLGESGAWRTIANDLAQRGHPVSSPKDLEPLLDELQNIRLELIQDHHQETMMGVRDIETDIETMMTEGGLFRSIANWFRIRSFKAKVTGLHKADSDYPSILDRTIDRIRSLINSAELSGAKAELSVIRTFRHYHRP